MNLNSSEIIPLHPIDAERTSKRAKRADAVANRQLILATAQRLFTEQGIANVCMAAIAKAAGIGKGTLYRSFANKGELCLALVDEDMRAFQNKTLQMLKEMHNQPALERLDAFLDNMAHFMDFHAPLLVEVQQQGVLQNDPEAQQASPYLWLPWLRETARVLLQQAEQSGEAYDLDIPYLVDTIFVPLNADLFMYQREVLGFGVERISRGVRRLVLEGCRGKISKQ